MTEADSDVRVVQQLNRLKDEVAALRSGFEQLQQSSKEFHDRHFVSRRRFSFLYRKVRDYGDIIDTLGQTFAMKKFEEDIKGRFSTH